MMQPTNSSWAAATRRPTTCGGGGSRKALVQMVVDAVRSQMRAESVHAFYVKYLLPIFFDVQSMEWQPGTAPTHRWQYATA